MSPMQKGKCAHCGAIKRFAEARVYRQSPGLVAQCAMCEHYSSCCDVRQRAFLDARGLAYLALDRSRLQEEHQPLFQPEKHE